MSENVSLRACAVSTTIDATSGKDVAVVDVDVAFFYFIFGTRRVTSAGKINIMLVFSYYYYFLCYKLRIVFLIIKIVFLYIYDFKEFELLFKSELCISFNFFILHLSYELRLKWGLPEYRHISPFFFFFWNNIRCFFKLSIFT